MKTVLIVSSLLLFAAAALAYYVLPVRKPVISNAPGKAAVKGNAASEKAVLLKKLKTQSRKIKTLADRKGYSEKYGFLIDMSIPSGKKRFFVYDLEKDLVVHAGLVAHGSCNESFRTTAYFSNTPGTGCSSNGIYKVGYAYHGRFGKSYKLFGLDSSNSNAFKRAVVLHAYDCVPDEETVVPLCNSLGCPMVSYNFRDTLSRYIDRSKKPILLWITGVE